MPSIVLGNPHASGAQLVISGNPWSGQIKPVGGIQLRWFPVSGTGGNCFIGFSGAGVPASSGGLTVTSGGFLLSGGANSGMMDGSQMGNGDGYYVPALAIQARGGQNLGGWNLCALTDTAGSGGRLNFEIF